MLVFKYTLLLLIPIIESFHSANPPAMSSRPQVRLCTPPIRRHEMPDLIATITPSGRVLRQDLTAGLRGVERVKDSRHIIFLKSYFIARPAHQIASTGSTRNILTHFGTCSSSSPAPKHPLDKWTSGQLQMVICDSWAAMEIKVSQINVTYRVSFLIPLFWRKK